MGTDANYQALPDGCGLLERAQQDREFGEWLSLLPYALARRGLHGPGSATDPVRIAFNAAIRQLMDEHPGIEDRQLLTVDRRWGALHYLLSEGRRHGEPYPDDLGTAAVRGATNLGGLRAGQGFPIRYNTAAKVREVAAWLERLTPDDLGRFYDPPRMEELAVYKFWADRADDEEWARIEEAFADLRSFYIVAVEHGEGALVVLD